MAINRQFRLAARPVGLPKESDFMLAEARVPSLLPGQVLLRSLYLSVDPALRLRLNEGTQYQDPVGIADVIMGPGIGLVVESSHPDFSPGAVAAGSLGWQEHAVADGGTLRKIDSGEAPLPAHLHVLGSKGLTAYFGLLDIANPQPGETVVVSGAAGAVGTIAGQIAKLKGCRVIGIAGTDEKVEYVVAELGFNAAFNYKTATNYEAIVKALCPQGVDIYFDNVGGAITDAVFPALNRFARVSVCGQISQYHAVTPELGPRLLPIILTNQIRVEGFLVSRYIERFAEGRLQLARWVREGTLRHREHIVDGFTNLPSAFIGMLQGENIGKAMVKVSNTGG